MHPLQTCLHPICLSAHCHSHENVIAVRDIMRPASQDYNDVYIVYELMDTDLHQVGRQAGRHAPGVLWPFVWHAGLHQAMRGCGTQSWHAVRASRCRQLCCARGSRPPSQCRLCTPVLQIIRSSQPLSDDHFQYFVYQAGAGWSV